jgi:hypothetical protein
MSEFDPSKPAVVHDMLNHLMFTWKPEWRDDYAESAVPSHNEGMMEWHGRILDG